MLTSTKAIIFDMDGVIFDSEKIYYDAFFVAADLHEIEASDDFVQDFAGKTTETCLMILQNFLGDEDGEQTQQFCRDWAQARQTILTERGLDFKEGFLTLFDAVKQSGRDIGLVTSANYSDVRDNFERHNLDLLDDFTHIITIEDVRHPKPHPQPYQIMMRQLGHAPEECLVIEDSPTGVNAAVSAGAKTLMINAHSQPPADIADKIIFYATHHDEILNFLQNNGL